MIEDSYCCCILLWKSVILIPIFALKLVNSVLIILSTETCRTQSKGVTNDEIILNCPFLSKSSPFSTLILLPCFTNSTSNSPSQTTVFLHFCKFVCFYSSLHFDMSLSTSSLEFFLSHILHFFIASSFASMFV